MGIRVQKKKFFGTEPESLEAANEVFTKFKKLSNTKIALNNLFIFTDDVQDINSPLFSLRGEFPFPELSTIPYPNGNKFKKLPDKLNIETFSIELYETAAGSAWDYYESWQSKVFNENENGVITYNLPEGPDGFKKNLVVYRYDAFFNKVFGYKYIGVFPTGISPYAPSADDPNVVTFTITFSVDDAVRIKNFGSDTTISKLDSNIKQPYAPDANEAWANAKNNADAGIAANKSELEQNRSLREKIYANTNVRKDVKSKITDAGLSEANAERLGGVVNKGAYSLFYSNRG